MEGYFTSYALFYDQVGLEGLPLFLSDSFHIFQFLQRSEPVLSFAASHDFSSQRFSNPGYEREIFNRSPIKIERNGKGKKFLGLHTPQFHPYLGG
jgi:hypothetical protein